MIWKTAAALLAVIALYGTMGTDILALEIPEESQQPSLTGQVLHTSRWDEHRKASDRFWEARRQKAYLRGPQVFWSGEKFLLQAQVSGEAQPPFIEVCIEGTDYSTRLTKSETDYRGALFKSEMLYLWGGDGPETLTFVFKGRVDGKLFLDKRRITVDDRQPYWRLHRKE